MARNGVWQLQKLVVNYCDWGGSSRGTREFLKKILPTLKEQNPQLEVTEALRRGQHPFLKAEYANDTKRVVDIKNKDAREVLEFSLRLRSAAGRKTAHRVRKRHITQQPSVQGAWAPGLDLGNRLDWANRASPRGAAPDAAAGGS